MKERNTIVFVFIAAAVWLVATSIPHQEMDVFAAPCASSEIEASPTDPPRNTDMIMMPIKLADPEWDDYINVFIEEQDRQTRQYWIGVQAKKVSVVDLAIEIQCSGRVICESRTFSTISPKWQVLLPVDMTEDIQTKSAHFEAMPELRVVVLRGVRK